MTNTTLSAAVADLVNENAPYSITGALPSARTQGLLADMIASEDIDEVKLEVQHVWTHYKALETMLNAAAFDPSPIILTLQDVYGRELTEAEVDIAIATTRVYAGDVVREAYHLGHHAFDGVAGADLPIGEVFAQIFPQLDFTDTRPVAAEAPSFDASLEAFLQSLLGDDTDLADVLAEAQGGLSADDDTDGK